ncbi:flippase-like domain-containing protein [Lactobacillus sp. S2-2]|uniref:lysylphosphatidylglycerol synthase transmembrane domain-containing protein n=1 Tax=Lactobacillus sp. S2-2 TaxID=2692917 RepID=UPI001F3B1C6C|nr:lysylphosphatidylglycerol synthase transmembrane domain-containing protein [Lactobacillus sp. S2-2]MCF6514835.1 flippase-like domain-containing protein [Lactobacillus sp. S2-2]
MTKRNKISLSIMLLLGILIFVYAARDLKFDVLMHDITTINPYWFLVAVFCILAYFGLESFITYLLIKNNNPNYTFKDSIRVPLVEQLFNGITPFASGGQPAQLFVLMQSGVDAGRASSALIMKFVVFQTMVVFNFFISLIIGFQYVMEKMHALSWLILFGFLIHLVVVIALLMIMYWHGFTKKIVNLVLKPVKFFISDEKFISLKSTLDEKIDNFYEESVHIAKQWKLMLKIVLITFVQLLFYYSIPYFIMLSLGYDQANIVMIISLHIIIFMIISIFPIPGGSGGAEYTFEMLFRSYISSSSKLLLAMMLWRILTYYLGLVLGVFALIKKPHKLNESKK